MYVMGVDPGATTGWCIYSADLRRVIKAGQFDGASFDGVDTSGVDRIVIEKPEGYGPTRPELVECGFVAGQLYERLQHFCDVELLTRRDVKRILTEATNRDVVVTKDASAWAALKLLHGGEASAKRGGALFGVKAHGRAALAVAVAFAIKQAKAAEVAS